MSGIEEVFLMSNSRDVKNLIIYGGVALGILICTQIYWFSKAFDANSESFDHTVSAALFAAADTMSDEVSVEKRAANYFYVTSNALVTSKTVDTLIRKELAARNILLEYEIGVYNAEDDSLVHVTSVKSPATTPFEDLKIEADATHKNFAVMFPTRESFLVGKNDLILITLIVLALIALFIYNYFDINPFSNTNNSLNTNQISLGACTLDTHNQILNVGKTSHQLTYKENQILKLFFENPNQVIERKVFLENIWEQDGFFVARSMDVFISKIRKYLKAEESVRIENLRSIGYRLVINQN